MFEKIRSIWLRITIQMLADKGYEMFSQLPDESRRRFCLGIIMSSWRIKDMERLQDK